MTTNETDELVRRLRSVAVDIRTAPLGAHPESEELVAWSENELDAETAATVAHHLLRCADCHHALSVAEQEAADEVIIVPILRFRPLAPVRQAQIGRLAAQGTRARETPEWTTVGPLSVAIFTDTPDRIVISLEQQGEAVVGALVRLVLVGADGQRQGQADGVSDDDGQVTMGEQSSFSPPSAAERYEIEITRPSLDMRPAEL